jgi:peptidyl-prolyl cis-trans isomerase C
MVKARHILVKEEAQAKDAKKRLDAGEDFAKVAEELSTDPGSKKRGGDLGWFTKERMVPEFSEVAFAQELNKISDPVKSKFGFHVIQTTEKRDTQPLEEVRAGIERLLSSNAVKDYTDKVKGGLNVELVGAFASTGGGDAAAAAPGAAPAPGMTVSVPAAPPAGAEAAPAAVPVEGAAEKHE